MTQNQKPDSSRGGMNRRTFINRSGLLIGATATARIATGKGALAMTTPTLVFINMRGGPDGLSWVAPYNIMDYQTSRPTIKIQQTNPRQSLNSPAMDPFQFCLPPGAVDAALGGQDMKMIYDNGDMVFAHGAGMTNQSRSHFLAMSHMEGGVSPNGTLLPSGYIGRRAATVPPVEPIVQLGHGNLLAFALAGAPRSLAVPDLTEYNFPGGAYNSGTQIIRTATIQTAYQVSAKANVKEAADTALGAQSAINGVTYPPDVTVLGYPDTELGVELAHTAALIKSSLHLESVHIDLASWDHHENQDPNNPGGTFYDMSKNLSHALGAFYNDLGGTLGTSQYLVVAMGEFGRRIIENGTFGTDHGHGGFVMLMGDGVHPGSGGKGGTVFHEFTGNMLANNFDNPVNMDLKLTVDYRDIMSEAFVRRFALPPGDVTTKIFTDGWTQRAVPIGLVG